MKKTKEEKTNEQNDSFFFREDDAAYQWIMKAIKKIKQRQIR